MADVEPDDFEQAFAGYVNGMSAQGQRALYTMGLGGMPVYNVHNYCSTGSSALHLGYQAIASGMNECVLAFGFEKMTKGPLDSQLTGLKEKYDEEASKAAASRPRMFGDGGRQHMELYGTTKEQFAKVSVKNHRHSVNNPRSQYRDACSLEEVLASRAGLRSADAAPVLPHLRRRRRGDPLLAGVRREARPLEPGEDPRPGDAPPTFRRLRATPSAGSASA